MINNTKLSFSVLDTHSCKTLAVYDTSYYNSLQTISNATLQIVTPFDDTAVQLNYYKNAVITLNSNTLQITRLANLDDLVDLPDGLYTGKISICPEDQFYYEKSWYRTCLLECKYNKALLKLDVTTCSDCFDKAKLEQLKRSGIYIQAIKANVENCNIPQADKIYKAVDKILTSLLDCDC